MAPTVGLRSTADPPSVPTAAVRHVGRGRASSRAKRSNAASCSGSAKSSLKLVCTPSSRQTSASRRPDDISRILRTMPRRVAIVGAGVTGLVAGRELARRGFSVELYERWPDVAGQASAFEVAPGVWLERYYHHLFPSDREM